MATPLTAQLMAESLKLTRYFLLFPARICMQPAGWQIRLVYVTCEGAPAALKAGSGATRTTDTSLAACYYTHAVLTSKTIRRD